MGKTMNSTVNKTPRVKARRSILLGLNKVLAKGGKMGKKILGPVSYGRHRVSSYLNSPVARSPAARRRREGHWVKEGEANTNQGQGD